MVAEGAIPIPKLTREDLEEKLIVIGELTVLKEKQRLRL